MLCAVSCQASHCLSAPCMLLMAHCIVTKQARAAAELAQQQQRQLQLHTRFTSSTNATADAASTASLLEPASTTSTADAAAVAADEADSNPAAQVSTRLTVHIECCCVCVRTCAITRHSTTCKRQGLYLCMCTLYWAWPKYSESLCVVGDAAHARMHKLHCF
jgi:hypothetical protein